uniref:NOP58 ribonucleoprotein n=1 Tax=Equus caballus TaxID=9796 RepID=A0A9L0R3E7_HORSE
KTAVLKTSLAREERRARSARCTVTAIVSLSTSLQGRAVQGAKSSGSHFPNSIPDARGKQTRQLRTSLKVLNEKKLQEVDSLWKEFETPEKANKIVKLKHFEKFQDTAEALAVI